MLTRVAIYHPVHLDRFLELLEPRFTDLDIIPARTPEEAERAVRDAEILLAHMSFPTEALSTAPNLRWVQVMAAGIEPWIGAVPHHIRLSRVTGSFGKRMSEYAIGYILAVTQRIPEVLRNQANRKWKPLELGVAAHATLGVAGLGSIGSEVVRKGAALGMSVNGFSLSRPDGLELDEWFGSDRLEDFMASADFLVLTLPVTPHTRGLIDAAALKSMRDGSWLINMARGDLVDEAALVEGLRRGKPAGAVLDVFATEPLPVDSPLWEMPNVIVTPHHSGAALPEEVVELFEENLDLYRREEPLINEVDQSRGY